MKAVNYAYRGNLPILHNLTKLEIVVDSSHWNLLLHILKSAPNLEVIVLYMKVIFKYAILFITYGLNS